MRKLPTGTVTLLFTDIEGSTLLLQQSGEHYADILASCLHLFRSIFQQWNGFEVDSPGDSFFVAFALASNAASAAAAVQRAIASYPWPEGVVVRIRMGLHTGEPQLSTEGYVGLDVHRAACIMSAGHGGQVLLSQTTYALVEQSVPEGLSLLDLGAHRLKDLQQPSHLFQLVIAGLPADFPPLKTLDAYPNNLPVQPTPFIGREQEVASLITLMSREEVRLLTLTGPGGIGKTRLGLQVAAELSDHFVDGVYFVNLAPLSDPEFVLPALAQVLDVKEWGERSIFELLKTSLREKQMLLLLDNFEQVVSAAVPVAELLAACPKLKILVTSRMALHVRAEQEFAVPPLALPDPKYLPDLNVLSQYEAVALFIARARAVKQDFQVTNATAPAVAEICVRLDGLPLAIELAAARIKLFSPSALLARLDQSLAVLTGGARDAPARQQTLRDTIAWSYHLLDAQEQRLFQRLSVFVGGCTLAASEAVCRAESEQAPGVLDTVASLLDKSLVQQTVREDEEPRLGMLETVREYGLEQLRDSRELGITQRTHAAYYLKLAEEVEPHLFGKEQAVWLERLAREYQNLRAAMNWFVVSGEKEAALRLGGDLWQFWRVHGPLSEGRGELTRLLKDSEAVAAPVRARALLGVGVLSGELGSYEEAETSCREALGLFRKFEDPPGITTSLWMLGRVAYNRGQYGAAVTLAEEALTLSEQHDDLWGMANALEVMSIVAYYEGRYEDACTYGTRYLICSRQSGDKKSTILALWLLGIAYICAGDLTRGHEFLAECLGLARVVGEERDLAWALIFFGGVSVLYFGGETESRALLAEGLMRARKVGGQEDIGWGLWWQACDALMQRDAGAARALLEEGFGLLRRWESRYTFMWARYLELLGEIATVQGELLWAARLWGTAEVMRTREGKNAMPPGLYAIYEQFTALAATQLGEEIYKKALEEGRMMTPEQAFVARQPVLMIMSEPAPTPRTPRGPASPGYPAGLTAREVEVLRLVAQGLTNEQVAEQIVVSPRTVSTHLTSIYNKLGVNSRSAATRFAVEHQLI